MASEANKKSQDTCEDKFLKPVRLTYQDPSFTQTDMEAANKINVWHKFILFNIDKEDKNVVLDNIVRTCSPVFVTPVMFKMEGEKKASFLLLCRSQTIQKLVNQKLSMKLPNGKIINYDIVLSFLNYKDMPLDPQKIITETIRLRIGALKSLNFANFSNDPKLGSVYVPINIYTTFDTVLRITKSVLTPNQREARLPVRDLILRSNNMDNLQFGEKLFSFHLTKIDLRNNNLHDILLLKPFVEYKITELWLDGNPLCYNYKSASDYINAVRTLFPSIQQLDGQSIGVRQKFLPVHHKHFIKCKLEKQLVKQFVEHYFACYDQDDRAVLNGLYDAKSLFSMTVGTIYDGTHQQIIKSFANNRNLLKFVDYAKCTEFLLYGPEKIISALRREPPTLHKLKYLDIDVMHSSNNCFTVSVQGPFIYRKIANAAPMFFQRTFIVVAKEDNEFCIINDQYHLDNCPANFLNSADVHDLKNITDKSVPSFNPVSFSTAEKHQLLRLLQELTTMTSGYSEKYLQEANWDIRNAIKTFMTSYTMNKIPHEAFIR